MAVRATSLEDFAFPSRTDHAAHISIKQYARLVAEWVLGIGFPNEDYGNHLLRLTKVSITYQATENLRVVQILGHTKIESTVRYLGVDVENALMLIDHRNLRSPGSLSFREARGQDLHCGDRASKSVNPAAIIRNLSCSDWQIPSREVARRAL
jgi:hypothetical protein